MISKEKLRKFLISRHKEANSEIAKDNAIHVYYYNLGHAHATAEIITKLDAGEFEEEAQK